jgi:hypothetical protein
MYDAAGVCGRYASCDLQRVRDGAARGQGSLPQTGAQRLAAQELGDHERAASLLAELKDRQDVGMRELRDAQSLAFEPHDGDRIGGERFPQDFDRHIAIESRIAGSIHLAHAAGAERADDLVLTEAGAGPQRHGQLFYVTISPFTALGVDSRRSSA